MKNPINAVSTHLMARNKTLPSNIINHSALTGAFHQPLLKKTRNNKRLQQRFRFSSTALSVCIAFAGLNLIPTLFTPLLFKNFAYLTKRPAKYQKSLCTSQ